MVRLAMAERLLGLAPEDQQQMPVTPGMEAFGPSPGAEDMMAPPPPSPIAEREMRGGAAPPDFDKDNTELHRHG